MTRCIKTQLRARVKGYCQTAALPWKKLRAKTAQNKPHMAISAFCKLSELYHDKQDKAVCSNMTVNMHSSWGCFRYGSCMNETDALDSRDSTHDSIVIFCLFLCMYLSWLTSTVAKAICIVCVPCQNLKPTVYCSLRLVPWSSICLVINSSVLNWSTRSWCIVKWLSKHSLIHFEKE